eukprot:gnl/MRDRNA2_/MRDRNA2_148036_c0_seq1.p1 gnl/MRDRNA2_/MRDRNA2_148036_c0~~gnl/MRDRNA2_/MRDRNA2_148036_c0_seq1.p1  ORF type:complete len:409 (-),score=70.79 gnl/MRDRNA2_/MRDRNA2_148036_c0_seq1:56-1282(-)
MMWQSIMMIATYMMPWCAADEVLPPYPWNLSGTLDASYNFDGQVRSYYVLTPLRPVPKGAIFFFHGATADAAFQAYAAPSFVRESLRRGFLLVFLQGVANPAATHMTKDRTWNSGTCCGYAAVSRPDDIAYTKAVKEDVLKHFPELDANKFFVTGISNGGSMVFRAGCELSELFSGLAAVVGSLEMRNRTKCFGECVDDGEGYNECSWNRTTPLCRSDDWLDTEGSTYECQMHGRKLPLLMFNGKLDAMTNISGAVVNPKNTSDPTSYYENYSPIDYVWDFFSKKYECSTEQPQTTFQNGVSGNATRCKSFVGCSANFTYCMSDAGHHWYGENISIPAMKEICAFGGFNSTECQEGAMECGPTTFSIDVTSQVLDFFERQAQPHVDDIVSGATPSRSGMEHVERVMWI